MKCTIYSWYKEACKPEWYNQQNNNWNVWVIIPYTFFGSIIFGSYISLPCMTTHMFELVKNDKTFYKIWITMNRKKYFVKWNFLKFNIHASTLVQKQFFFCIYNYNQMKIEASEPKWDNSILNIVRVNSLRLGGL